MNDEEIKDCRKQRVISQTNFNLVVSVPSYHVMVIYMTGDMKDIQRNRFFHDTEYL